MEHDILCHAPADFGAECSLVLTEMQYDPEFADDDAVEL